MVAYNLKGLGWGTAVFAMALGFYLVSLQVATERGRLEALDRDIARAERDIRMLETEFNARANFRQLERWNGDVLALTAPGTTQFVDGEAQLAALQVAPGGDNAVMTTLVSAGTSGAAEAPQPVVREAVVREAVVREAVVTRRRTDVPPPVLVRTVQTKPRPPERVAMLDDKLLSSATLGDILDSARAETGRGLR